MDPIKAAIKKVEDLYGNVLIRASELEELQKISTGIKSLDEIIFYPVGAIIEILGQSSVKSSIAYVAISQFQKAFKNKTILYISTNNNYHKDWAKQLGVDNSNVYLLNSNDLIKIFEIMKTMILSDALSLIVLDDIPGLSLQNISDDEFNQKRAQYLSQLLRQIKQYLKRYNSTLILINQPRSDNVSIGGRSVVFNSDIRILLKPVDTNYNYIKVTAELLKNNYAAIDKKSTTIKLNYNIGFE